MPVNRVKLYFLYAILFLVFTQGFWERYTPIPAQPILEILIIGITLLSYKSILNPLCYNFLFVLSVGLICSISTASSIAYFKSIRFVLYFFFLYDIYRSTHFEIHQYLRLLKFLMGLVLLQGIASIIQIFVIEKQIEGYVGYMSSLGGSTATTFLVLVLSICMVILLYSNKQLPRKYIYFILLCIASAMLVGYSSGKRTIYFIAPITIILSVFLTRICINKYRLVEFRKKLIYISILIIILLPIYIIGATSTQFQLDNQVKKSGNRMGIISSMIEYAIFYENSEHKGRSTGRSGTTENILKSALNDSQYFLVGSGFNSYKNQNIARERNVIYGIVGFTRDVFSGGIIFAVLMSLWFIKAILYHDKIEQDPFSITLKYMILFSFLFTHFAYSADYVTHLKLTSLLILILPIINSKEYVHIKEYLLTYLK